MEDSKVKGNERWTGAIANLSEMAANLDSLQKLLVQKAVYVDEETFAKASLSAEQARTINVMYSIVFVLTSILIDAADILFFWKIGVQGSVYCEIHLGRPWFFYVLFNFWLLVQNFELGRFWCVSIWLIGWFLLQNLICFNFSLKLIYSRNEISSARFKGFALPYSLPFQ